MGNIVFKFGRNDAVGTTFVPVALGGVYRTPQASGATALRVKAGGNANDTAAGSGARAVTLVGLDENFEVVSETIATAGASASSATTATFTRLYRAWVSASGTYATATAGSHSGDIVIENAAGGTDWLTIDSTGFPKGQSDVGCISLPAGAYAWIRSIDVFVDSSKTARIIGFKREQIDQTAAPYEAMRGFLNMAGVSGQITLDHHTTPVGPFQGPCDVGFMARVEATTAEVAVDFEIEIFD